MRVVMNIIPIDLQNLKVDFDSIDSLQAIETLSSQTEADYFLKQPQRIISSLEKEAINEEQLKPSIIKKFL